jgi:Fur family ferric uptake transcriptional regulator
MRDTEAVIGPSVSDPAVVERMGELLRSHGLRRMASRIAVLAVLEPVRSHLSVAEIDQTRIRE